jgi:hypothetical protein
VEEIGEYRSNMQESENAFRLETSGQTKTNVAEFKKQSAGTKA